MNHRLSISVIIPLLLYFLFTTSSLKITNLDVKQAPITSTISSTTTTLTSLPPTITITKTPVTPTTEASSTFWDYLLEFLKILTTWHIILGAALIVFRRPITQFLEDIGKRATKISIAQFSVELPISHSPPEIWTGLQLAEALQASPIVDSGEETLINQFNNNNSFDHLIVDIELGQKWLTSRLFLFATMLQRMNGLRCIVFLYTKGDKPRTFLGVAHAEELHWVIAQEYPWLEAAYTNAYAKESPTITNERGDPIIVDRYIQSNAGRLNSNKASNIAKNFLSAIQVHDTPTFTPPKSIETTKKEWSFLERKYPRLSVWEHGEWLTESWVRSKLQTVLLTQAYVIDSPDLSSTKRQKAIVNRPGRFVALVDEERVFQELIDRQTLLERIGKHLAEPVDN